MQNMDLLKTDFYAGLTELVEDAFPRECSNCGRLYKSAEEFIEQTEAIRGRSGLTEYPGQEGKSAIYLFRNCVCGSTLMELFRDRRDLSLRGQKVREKFAQLMEILGAFGLDLDEARAELLKLLSGEESQVLNDLGFKVRRKTAFGGAE
ncbi:MAG: hypothetical protein ACLFOY_06385 [Desulfatibacillaceae bacterium]